MNKGQLSKLTEFKSHRYSDVRSGLVHALCGVENALAIRVMIELSEDKHPDVRNWATFSIGTQIETSNEMIIKALWIRTKDKDTRHEAIIGLWKRKDSRIEELLRIELACIDEQESSILESLNDLSDKEFISLLK